MDRGGRLVENLGMFVDFGSDARELNCDVEDFGRTETYCNESDIH